MLLSLPAKNRGLSLFVALAFQGSFSMAMERGELEAQEEKFLKRMERVDLKFQAGLRALYEKISGRDEALKSLKEVGVISAFIPISVVANEIVAMCCRSLSATFPVRHDQISWFKDCKTRLAALKSDTDYTDFIDMLDFIDRKQHEVAHLVARSQLSTAFSDLRTRVRSLQGVFGRHEQLREAHPEEYLLMKNFDIISNFFNLK